MKNTLDCKKYIRLQKKIAYREVLSYKGLESI